MRLQYILSETNGERLLGYIADMRNEIEKLSGIIENDATEWEDAYGVVSDATENLYNYLRAVEITLRGD